MTVLVEAVCAETLLCSRTVADVSLRRPRTETSQDMKAETRRNRYVESVNRNVKWRLNKLHSFQQKIPQRGGAAKASRFFVLI
jgi:hypothetical protein